MNIKEAQYHEQLNIKNIKATIDGDTMHVPLDPNNRHYAEILEQIKAGTLTIKDAD